MSRSNRIETVIERLRACIGLRSPPFTMEVEKGAIRDFARAIGENAPLYLDEAYARTTRFGTLVAPPTFLSRWLPEVVEGLLVFDLPFKRNVHGEDLVTNHRPILAGDVITAIGTYADAFVKAGSLGPMIFQHVEVALTDANGESVADVRVSSVSY